VALSEENHALTDFGAHARREGWRMMNGRAKGRQLDCHAAKMCLRDVFARKTQKGTRRGGGSGGGGCNPFVRRRVTAYTRAPYAPYIE